MTDDLSKLLEQAETRRRFNRLQHFEPTPKQRALYALGKIKRERAIICANRSGKSEGACSEYAYHLTGRYPKDWVGHRFTHPIRSWACGETAATVRDIIQAKLTGTPGVVADWGTGLIPKECLLDRSLGHGAVDVIDTLQVKHISDGVSTAKLMTYQMPRTTYQGETLHFILWDEEPPIDLYGEGWTRLVTTEGLSLAALTPLKGRTTFISRFMDETVPWRAYLNWGITDSGLYTPERAEEILAEFSSEPHLRDARAYGIPAMGAGRVWLTPEELLKEAPIEDVPPWWKKLWGIDFGIGHFFAAVLIAWDPESDIVHILHTIKMKDATPLQHVPLIRAICADAWVAWPHDGTHRDKGSGEALADIYRKPMPGMPGLKMLDEHSTWEDGGYSTERAVVEVDIRAKTGRLRVASTLEDFFAEYRQYHRIAKQDGTSELVKVNDDVLSALFKCVMMLRRAKPCYLTRKPGEPRRRSLEALGIEDGPRRRPTHSRSWDPLSGALL